MHLPPLETEHLIIRPFRTEDLDAVRDCLDSGPDGSTREDRERWLRWSVASYRELEALMQPPYGDRAVVLRESEALIGACGLVPSLLPLGRGQESTFERRFLPEVGLYYALAPGARGQGLATEAARALSGWALRELGLARVVATTTHDNVRSIAVMERLGMRILRNTSAEPHWLQVVGVLDAS